MVALDEQQCTHRTHHGTAGRVAGGACGGLHAVIFKNREVGPEYADTLEHRAQGKRENARRDRYPQTPSGFKPDVEVGQAHYPSEEAAHEHGPSRELWQIAAVHRLEPLKFYFGWSLSLRIDSRKIVQSFSLRVESRRSRGTLLICGPEHVLFKSERLIYSKMRCSVQNLHDPDFRLAIRNSEVYSG